MGVCNIDFNFKDIKGLDKVLNTSNKLRAFEDKLKCHPLVKDSVLPQVKIIWNFWPFTYLCAECAYPLEFFCVLCNPLYLCFCWCYYPFIFATAIPWNLFWYTFVDLPLILFCYPCWW